MPSPKRPRDENGLNQSGNGRGIGKVTRPQPKKRGASAGGNVAQARARGMDTSSYENAELIDPNKPLTEKQRAFVKFWAQGESIATASIKAGYNDGASLAYRMVRMPNILKLYEEEKRLYEEACQMTRKRVMDGLLEGIEMAKLMAEPATVISGWREVGKMCGYYEPVKQKIELSVKGEIAMKTMERMSDEELMKLLAQGPEALLPAPTPEDEGEDA